MLILKARKLWGRIAILSSDDLITFFICSNGGILQTPRVIYIKMFLYFCKHTIQNIYVADLEWFIGVMAEDISHNLCIDFLQPASGFLMKSFQAAHKPLECFQKRREGMSPLPTGSPKKQSISVAG